MLRDHRIGPVVWMGVLWACAYIFSFGAAHWPALALHRAAMFVPMEPRWLPCLMTSPGRVFLLVCSGLNFVLGVAAVEPVTDPPRRALPRVIAASVNWTTSVVMLVGLWSEHTGIDSYLYGTPMTFYDSCGPAFRPCAFFIDFLCLWLPVMAFIALVFWRYSAKRTGT